MVKVCHVTCAHPKEDVRIYHKECVSLASAGYDVYLVEQGDSYDQNGVHIVGLGQMPESRAERMTAFAKKAYRTALALDAQIYHLHDPELLPFALKLKRQGKKVIFDSHERYTEQFKDKHYLPKWVSRSIAAVYGFVERSILRRIDAVIFPCTMDGKNPFEGMCKRAAIISNAAILGEFFHRYDPNYPKKPRQICYVGGLTEARGITQNMRAAHAAGATLALAGAFSPESYGEALKTQEAYSCVEHRGNLSRKDVADLLAESQIGLCTLLDQGQYLKIDTFGIKVFEYMSMGLPVILSNSPYNCTMTEKYGFGICVDPTDVKQQSDAISMLLDDPEMARKMGENGRKAIMEELNWGIEERKLFALYEDILKEDQA